MNCIAEQLHMLVVDDDDVDRERVRRFLDRSTLSVNIMEASCGADALHLIKNHCFDCVVLDNHLGDSSGAELMSQLRDQSCQDCPIIMITGAGNEALAVKAMHEGASDYLAKTQLNAEVLVRSIKRSVEHHRVRTELAAMHQQLAQRVEEQAATIRQRERDLQAVIDNAPTVMGYWDSEQRCRFGNHTHGEWFGIDTHRLEGCHLQSVLGPELYDTLHPYIDAALAGQTQRFEQTLASRDGGNTRHAQIQLRPDLSDDGRVQGFYATMADVTPIKMAQDRAEEFLRFSEAVIAHSPIGIAVFTPGGLCVIANAAFVAAFGDSIDTLRQSDFRQRPHWQACGLVTEAQRAMQDGLQHRLDVTLVTTSGHEVQLACALSRVDRSGQAHLLLIARDISEQRQAHAALVSARDAAESAARTKGAFLANMSHEIRTPMNAIIGLSRLALEDTLPQVAREYLDKIYTSAVALMGILDDVLDYSKIEAGHMHFERIAFDMEEVLQRVADLFQARIEQKALHFSIDLSPDVPRRLMGDPLRLSQVLSNLLGNAIKFTESGGIHIRISTWGAAPQAPHAMLFFSIKDTGIGMPTNIQAQLFDAFVQGDSSITRRFGGTGLGLAICKKLVQLMDGQIGVNSELGIGSEFWFTASLPTAPITDDSLATPRDLAGKNVLIVDGHEYSRQGVARQLLSWHAHVFSAPHIDQVQSHLQSLSAQGQPLDALIVDFESACGHHTANLKALKERVDAVSGGHWQTTLLLMVNAREQHAHLYDLQDWPRHAVLIKPVLATRLFEAMQSLAAPSPLPRHAAHKADANQLRAQSLKDMARPLQGAHILLVEDNHLNQIVAEGFLRQLGLLVTVAADGAQAVKIMQISAPHTFAAILMDLHMPVLDGLEATRRICAMDQDVPPIIGMTAAVLPEDRDRCMESGMVDHISKPIVPERLIEALLTWTRPGNSPAAATSDTRAAMPSIAQWDIDALRQRVHGNETIVRTLLQAFVNSEAHSAKVITDMLSQGDVVAARLKVHDIKGSSANLGAMQLAHACATLESALINGKDISAALIDFEQVLHGSLLSIRPLLAHLSNLA